MLKLLVLLSALITIGVATILHLSYPQESCETRGGHYEYLESVTGDAATKICVSDDEIDPP